MRNVVLVDTYAPSSSLAPAFIAAGFSVVRVQSTVEVPLFYRGHPDPAEYLGEIIHRGDLAETVRLTQAYEPVAVLPGGEIGVELADALSAALGVPSNGTALSSARRNKFDMVERVTACGLRGAEQLRVEDADQLREWHTALGGRAVLKPLRSAAGDGVTWCDTPEESVEAYRKLCGRTNVFSEPGDGVVAQEYLVGAEYLVNTVSMDGAHQVCDIWKTERISANGVRDLTAAVHLLRRRGELQDVLVPYAFELLDALGIRHGPAHVEIKMTPDGPRMMEVGARMSGLMLPRLARIACGESQVDWTVDAYVRPERFAERCGTEYVRERTVAWAGMVSPYEGVLREYTALAEIKALESFHELNVMVRPGDRIARTIDDSTYPAAVTLVHEVDEIVLRDLGTVRYLDGAGCYDVSAD